MSIIFLALAAVVLTIILTTWAIVGMREEGCVITCVIGLVVILGLALIPMYPSGDDPIILDVPVSETDFGYVAYHNNYVYRITDHAEVASSSIEDIKLVDDRSKCGFGWYSTSGISLENINKLD